MSTDPRDEVRAAMARYPTSPARTRAALSAALGDDPEPAPAEQAAAFLSQYMTPAEIREGLESGALKVTAYDPKAGQDGEQR